ncbi:Z1 domain-containing protein [Burkholderia sp. IDO3]|uniref:Z1 domain-containing protein n=1 Tax=Burkholderia sp. IDO3 TaxID=1705310 RepID=UPI000BBAF872|nr:Z1 domain-containing protein [Burkholderia sp. IDO3]AXK66969.1 endonuclease [Burkholderia sp. IDO3]PCD56898.1 endonuclease [Burkholderia sp. IDO3]
MSTSESIQTKIISIAQILLRDAPEETTRSPSAISENVRIASTMMKASPSDYDEGAAVAELIRRFSHWVPNDSALTDPTGHEDWFQPSMKKDWRYWQRLQRYLERSLAVNVVEALDRSTDGIMAQLEDPKRDAPWDRRGLVVGHVQSGKTSSYSALICKAADAGYKIIVVLAGMHNNLRSQTQMRLEEAFLGYETAPNRDPGNPIGVFFEDRDPNIHPNCATSRDEKGDFNGAAAKKFSVSPEQRPWLFVVKKNKSVLEKLLKWMRSNHVANATDPKTGRRVSTNLPLLVIDDEADNASIDTGEQEFDENGTPDPEHEPKAINSLIRQILDTFAKSAYVGYTATPFANVFIHRRGKTNDEGEDLFPRSFIRNLAAPSNYVGPTRVFGITGPDGMRTGGLPLVHEFDDHTNIEGGGWMPRKHNKDHIPMHGGEDTLPPSLREAIYSFLLACAARACRGQKTKHCSMLVHVTRLTLVQNQVRRQIDEFVKRISQRLARKVDADELLAELHDLWESDFVSTHDTIQEALTDGDRPAALPSWDEIASALPDAATDIVVKTINGSVKDALDYVEKETTGLKVIAIGGDKLARGLTLEGLTTSYFVRTTKMYDTLMQMGRWFGYRPGYLDLCRLYTTSDLIQSFGLIADAAEELRQEFDAMVAVGATPDKYGLKVASHPSLLVTSPMKMRTAQTVRLSYSGSLTQTIAFPGSTESLQGNLDAADRLIASMGSPTASKLEQERPDKLDDWPNSLLWRNVSSDKIKAFLRAYSAAPGIERANGAVMAEFVDEMNKKCELDLWTVALVAEGKDNEGVGPSHTFAKRFTVTAMPTRSKKKGNAKGYSIGVLTESHDEGIDVGIDEWNAALDATIDAWKRDGSKGRPEPLRPSGRSLRDLRAADRHGANHRGLLLLYPLSPVNRDRQNINGWDKPIIGFAASFPSSDQEVSVEYKVDHLLWEEQYGSAE